MGRNQWHGPPKSFSPRQLVKRLASFIKARKGGKGKAIGNQEEMEKKIRAQSKELALLNAKLKAATTTLGKGKDR